MEYVEGGDLYKHLIKQDHFPEAKAKLLFKELLEAMKYLHEQGIVHRDIKLENIMLTSDFKPKIIDFGIARELQEDGMKSQVGTPSYIAPEIIKGERYSEKVDMFSMGVALYVFLCGYLPF